MNVYAAVVAKKRGEEGGGPGGAVFVSDTFTGSDGTDLTSHTGETGATWAKVTGVTGLIKITSNAAKGDSAGNSLYYASGTPDTNEYDVEADLVPIAVNDNVAIGGRMSTGEYTGYFAKWDNNNDRWDLLKVVAGTETSLGTYDDSLIGLPTKHMKLELRDAAKKLFIDGVERISSGDNAVTSTGKAGIFYNNSDWGLAGTGRRLDNFVATNA